MYVNRWLELMRNSVAYRTYYCVYDERHNRCHLYKLEGFLCLYVVGY